MRMNNLFILLFLLLIAGSAQSYSQECINDDASQPCCNGIISTDPRNAPDGSPYGINQARPSLKNNFNWMDEDFWVYHPNSYGTTNNPYFMGNPFFSETFEVAHLNYRRFGTLERIPENLDFWPQDGWELIHKQIGYDINGINLLLPHDNRRGPYFILYNKYTGVLRLFASVDEDFSQTKYVASNIYFDLLDNNLYKTSALLSGQENVSQPLDTYTTSVKIGATSKPASCEYFWTSDYYMSYDPCVCNYRSQLMFSFDNFVEAQLNLSGGMVGTVVPLDGSGNSPLLNGRDFMTSVKKNGYNAEAGKLTYSNIDGLVARWKTPELSLFEELCLTAFKAVLKGAAVAADGLISTALGGPYNAMLANMGIFEGDTTKTQKVSLGIVSSLTDNLTASLGKRTSFPNIGFIEAEILLTGTYVNSNDIPSSNFSIPVPGSKDTENPFIASDLKYPAYNEALGIFALLRTPIVKKHYIESEFEVHGIDGLRTAQRIDATYKLDEFVYYFNPASEIDLEKTKISVSLNWLDLPSRGSSNLIVEGPIGSYNSAYLPLSCFMQSYLSTWGDNANDIDDHLILNDDYSFFVNILIDAVFKENKYGKVNRTLLKFKYPAKVIAADLDLSQNTINIDMFKEIGTTHFTTSQTINAWNIIKITGNLTCDPNVTINIIAGDEIIVSPGVVISPNINLKIGLPNCGTHPQATANYVKSFCSCNDYKANQMPDSYRQNFVKKEVSIGNEAIAEEFLNIFPNPASNEAKIDFSIIDNNNITIVINDIFGNEMLLPINNLHFSKGTHSIPIELSSLPVGTYNCVLTNGLHILHKKFIVVK